MTSNPESSSAAPPLRVAIIGGGGGGVAALKHALDMGMDATLFERGKLLGGVWANYAYHGAFASLHHCMDKAVVYDVLMVQSNHRVLDRCNSAITTPRVSIHGVGDGKGHERRCTLRLCSSTHHPRVRIFKCFFQKAKGFDLVLLCRRELMTRMAISSHSSHHADTLLNTLLHST